MVFMFIGMSQLQGTTKTTIVYSLIDSLTHLHNICHNCSIIEKYNHNFAAMSKNSQLVYYPTAHAGIKQI
jgi:hypothetical protein